MRLRSITRVVNKFNKHGFTSWVNPKYTIERYLATLYVGFTVDRRVLDRRILKAIEFYKGDAIAGVLIRQDPFGPLFFCPYDTDLANQVCCESENIAKEYCRIRK